MERRLTTGPGGRVLTNANVWSPDGRWIAYDTRSAADGGTFDGTQIRLLNVDSGKDRCVYESRNGACCGVVTWHPSEPFIAFILGPEHPTPEWSYSASHRQGVLVDIRKPGVAINLDARDLTPPFTAGALRGGSHVHMFRADGNAVSFTYEDAVLNDALRSVAVAKADAPRAGGVSPPCVPPHGGLTPPAPTGLACVTVPTSHDRNHAGAYFTVNATNVTATPRPGSDDISRACEEAWLGTSNRLAFQGTVLAENGSPVVEVFVVKLPDDWAIPGDSPLQGTATAWPAPPRGTIQRRLTRTTHRKHPGLQGPRHWLRSDPAGTRIGCLIKDDAGVVQLWTVDALKGDLRQITDLQKGIGSAFTWSPDGRSVFALVDDSVAKIDIATGVVTPLTEPSTPDDVIRPEAVVVSPDGSRVAYVRHQRGINHLHVCDAFVGVPPSGGLQTFATKTA